MTVPHPAPATPGRSYALYTDPARERKVAVRMSVVTVAMLLLLALAVIDIAGDGFRIRNVTFVLIGLGGGLAAGLMAVNGFALARRTGEDLLTIAVEEPGLVGPEQMRIPWQAVSGVEHLTHGKAQRSTAGHAPHSVRIHVRDHDGFASTLTDDQRLSLKPTTNGQGRVDVGLGMVTEQQFGELVDALGAATAQRGIPFREGDPDAD
ncbi:hypothetical protein FB554_0391 [Barrientosiimonas humi]|uniref:Uncharacterized protein n=1 Tax=Barrientosiimonas humi TaxID=999931 RepID=A0A542X8X8_9MICO|nr:hypothetical protein [Barrientosiimonas humi]TQL32270.1 hypothetical protein FB554_0391 [Barrientosiimonas humi]CAG7572258.1 hypothetical protein BH39T_PBIAJDOK_00872 [Barrientosiimonas humi]